MIFANEKSKGAQIEIYIALPTHIIDQISN